jgi:hypothetical protein
MSIPDKYIAYLVCVSHALVANMTSSSQVRPLPDKCFFKAGNIKIAGYQIQTVWEMVRFPVKL